MRAAVAAMVLRSYEMQGDAWESGADEEEVLDPPVGGRLGEIRCPTLVLVGEHDVADMRAIAAHLAESIEDVRLVTVAGASHLPSLERPDEVNKLLLDFLGA
jgi:pimeloyl-ACP methyl ester carboxylesterase